MSAPEQITTQTPKDDFADRQAEHFAKKLGLDSSSDVVIDVTGDISTAPSSSRDLTFPKSALKGILGELAELLSGGSEIAPEMAFGAAMTCLSSMVSGHLVTTKADSDVRLYTVLLGESDRAKKSSVITRTVKFFKNNVSSGLKLNTCDQVGSAEGLARMLNSNGNVLLTLDELEVLFRKAGIEGSVLLQAIASLYEKTRYETVTKNEHILIENARLAIVAACTFATYERVWERASLAIGLDNRLFLVNADARPPVAWPTAPSERECQKMGVAFQVLLAKIPLGNSPLILEGTEAAKRRYDEWYRTLYAMNTPYVKRLEGVVSRIMPLLAFAQGKDEIDRDVVDQGIALGDHQLNLRRCYNPIDAENQYALMEQKIIRALSGRGPLKDWELAQYTNSSRAGTWIFTQALQSLVSVRTIEKRADGKWYLRVTGGS